MTNSFLARLITYLQTAEKGQTGKYKAIQEIGRSIITVSDDINMHQEFGVYFDHTMWEPSSACIYPFLGKKVGDDAHIGILSDNVVRCLRTFEDVHAHALKVFNPKKEASWIEPPDEPIELTLSVRARFARGY